VTRRSLILALFVPLAFSGCSDESDFDRNGIPQPTLEEEGPIERAGRRLDNFTENAGKKVRHGVEETGDAAERAGDWLERKTDEKDAIVDDHDVPPASD
jgi:hypothetical protein